MQPLRRKWCGTSVSNGSKYQGTFGCFIITNSKLHWISTNNVCNDKKNHVQYVLGFLFVGMAMNYELRALSRCSPICPWHLCSFCSRKWGLHRFIGGILGRRYIWYCWLGTVRSSSLSTKQFKKTATRCAITKKKQFLVFLSLSLSLFLVSLISLVISLSQCTPPHAHGTSTA